jgi:hypothetical protein
MNMSSESQKTWEVPQNVLDRISPWAFRTDLEALLSLRNDKEEILSRLSGIENLERYVDFYATLLSEDSKTELMGFLIWDSRTLWKELTDTLYAFFRERYFQERIALIEKNNTESARLVDRIRKRIERFFGL